MVAGQESTKKNDKLIGVKAIGNYISRSESTVMKLIQEKKFPAGKVGEIWEANKSDVDRWRLGEIEKSKKASTRKKRYAGRRGGKGSMAKSLVDK